MFVLNDLSVANAFNTKHSKQQLHIPVVFREAEQRFLLLFLEKEETSPVDVCYQRSN
jgi:hypothetical protein